MEAEGVEETTLEDIGERASITPGHARKLAHDLVRKRWLQRIRRGVYLLNPGRHGPDALPDTDPLRLGSRLVDPYYFGFATAAELHGVLPQASHVYYVVTTSRATPVNFQENRYRFIRVVPRSFFGVEQLERRGVKFQVSDLEKTFVDCLNRPELAGGMAGVAQILALAKPRIRWARLGLYLNRMANRNLTLRTGYLVEVVRPSVKPPPGWIRPRLARRGDGFAPLGPPKTHGRRGARDRRWHVIQNVPPSLLFAEGEIL